MRSLIRCCSRYKGLSLTKWSAMKLERWLTMSRQRSGLQIHLWGQWGATFLLGWATVQIPLQRGQPTVLYKGNHSKIKKKALTQSEQLRQPCIDTQQKRQTQFDIRLSGVVSRNPATVHSVDLFPIENTNRGWWCKQHQLGVCTRAGCQRADWRQWTVVTLFRGWISHKVLLS